MKLIGSLLWGITLGISAVLLHDVYFPFGLALALVGSSAGIWILGRAFGKKIYKFLGIIGWVGVVFKGAVPGVGNELLVQGNTSGNALVLIGALALMISFFVTN